MYRTGVMTPTDRVQAVDWAASEGWNPGIRDMDCFERVDPDGFWGGWLDDRLVASISVVNYDPTFAFLGFYIVTPGERGQGMGYRLWQDALAHAGDRVVGLDGVVDQQDNYRKSGFDLAYRNIRFGGRAGRMDSPAMDVRPADAPFAALEQMDRRVFPAPRPTFWKAWLGAEGHRTVAAFEGERLTGFATLRPCRAGHKIGPLVAASDRVARAVLAALTKDLDPDDEVFLDVPEPNAPAVALAEHLGLSPVFETARMYRGPAPEVDLEHIFGVTSFELG
ncbi:GNAT family N-acetyltransferase [Phaeobacter marinintestinus]|uniref:GNAT family N-acetyltransferase n=1 Tax=Falsiphaeobacter marinintestinus TaxID=1492905 RepID=UPI0011B471D2|nr:GNAT family N-acetyltransferase [Phaeobacter marinintestinus]